MQMSHDDIISQKKFDIMRLNGQILPTNYKIKISAIKLRRESFL